MSQLKTTPASGGPPKYEQAVHWPDMDELDPFLEIVEGISTIGKLTSAEAARIKKGTKEAMKSASEFQKGCQERRHHNEKLIADAHLRIEKLQQRVRQGN